MIKPIFVKQSSRYWTKDNHIVLYCYRTEGYDLFWDFTLMKHVPIDWCDLVRQLAD